MPKRGQTSRPRIPETVAADARSKIDRLEDGATRRGLAFIADDDLVLPDTAAARGALALTRSASPDFLLNHSLRTYLFGLALARRDGLKLDREVFFLGAVMHDLGLTERYSGAAPFEASGAQAAYDFLDGHGYDADKAVCVREAITFHTMASAETRAPEIALVRIGAGVDLIGIRHADLAPDAIERILAAWPRHDFKTCFHALLEREAARLPDSMIGRMLPNGLAEMIRGAPFAE